MATKRGVERLQHDLAHRLTVADVAAIAATLDETHVEKHLAALPLVHPSGAVKRIRIPTSEVLEGRGGEPWWLMLSGVHRTDAAKICWPEAQRWVKETARTEGGVLRRSTTILVSSPGSVVPAHIDHEHNVLLQIEGTKEVVAAPASSVEIDIERCITRTGRNLDFLPPHSETFRLWPGEGLYLPPATPHWVSGEEGISISVSCAWSTAHSETEQIARYWNARQRKLRLAVRPPDGGRISDKAKAAAVRLHWRLVKSHTKKR